MKIRCRRDKFLPLFSLTVSFAVTRDVSPALQNVKLSASDAGVTLMATDGDVGARVELSENDAITVEEVGDVVLPAKLLRKILAETTTE
ncbi:MAG: DNA polymerase III subunit beta, partial [Thermoguttaceae bacterium]|nr:DNA polymerase III subunit beta [Thermoguttaceae bacterium]